MRVGFPFWVSPLSRKEGGVSKLTGSLAESTSCGSDAGAALRRTSRTGLSAIAQGQKLESQVVLKLPSIGDTVGQPLGNRSNRGPNCLCPTQSRK